MTKFFIKTLKVIVYLAFVAAAIVYLPKILASTLDTEYPIATITSGSMWPALKTNDLILMKGATADEIEVGQIVIFKNSAGFTIHRFVRRENGKLITKGDANGVEDNPIDPEDVIGRIVYLNDKPLRIPMIGVIAKNLAPKLQNLQGN